MEPIVIQVQVMAWLNNSLCRFLHKKLLVSYNQVAEGLCVSYMLIYSQVAEGLCVNYMLIFIVLHSC